MCARAHTYIILKMPKTKELKEYEGSQSEKKSHCIQKYSRTKKIITQNFYQEPCKLDHDVTYQTIK